MGAILLDNGQIFDFCLGASDETVLGHNKTSDHYNPNQISNLGYNNEYNGYNALS